MPKTWALLFLVSQQPDSKSSFDNESFIVNVAKIEYRCVNHNIVSGKATSHHRSCGCIHGFGSRRNMCINKNTVFTFEVCCEEGWCLHQWLSWGMIEKSIESVCGELYQYMGYDILLDNCNSLSVGEKYAQRFGISRDFHLLGHTGYTLLFYNFNASTLDHHTEMDWLMTTIYVPNQEWKNKLDDHLQFLFHLTDEKHGILHVSMWPGTIIYFHGSLLMHQQLHNHGEVIAEGCCLNFLAYANWKLLCHYIQYKSCKKKENQCE